MYTRTRLFTNSSYIFLVATIFLFHKISSIQTETTESSLNFSGWKPMIKSEALSTAEFAERLASPKQLNSTDLEAADTKRSFLLVYPPRAAGSPDEPKQISPPEKPPRIQAESAPKPQSRHQRTWNLGVAEGQNQRDKTPAVYQRPMFPPVANPPPLPEHAIRNRNRPFPNYTPESTANHQVQIQLLDGYIVPQQGGGRPSSVHGDKKAPQITTFPLNLNNVPEIRLLLPGDVHQQLNNLRPPPHQQNNRQPQTHQQPQGQGGNGQNYQRDFQHQVNQNAHSFESQRRPGRAEYDSNERHAGSNYGNSRSQQQNTNRHTEQRPIQEFSPPDRAVYPESVNFPGRNGPDYQNNPQPSNGAATGSNTQTNPGADRNNVPEENINTRPVAGIPNNSGSNAQNPNPNYENQQNDNSNYNSQNAPNLETSGQRFQKTHDFNKENFRPLLNENRNRNLHNDGDVQNAPSATPQQDAGRSAYQNTNFNVNANRNVQQGNAQNSYSSGWQATQTNRGKQNYNRVLMPPEMVHFYNVNSNNQNQNSQSSPAIKATFNNNQNINSQSVPNFSQDSNSATVSQGSSGQDTNNRRGTSIDDQFRGRRTSTDDFNTRPDFSDSTSTSTGGSAEDIYFAPPVISQDTIQTQIESFDNQKTGDASVGTSGDTVVKTGRRDETPFEQTEFGNVGNTGSGRAASISRQTDPPFAKNVQCECAAQSCAPIERSPGENLGSSIREVARSLNADLFFDFVGLTDEEIENTLSSDGSYTLFIPSNEAVARLPSNLIDHWRNNNPDLTTALLNHVVRDRIPLNQLKLGGKMTSKANDATIFINNYNNEAVTVNGHRIIDGDVTGPRGGTIHVIDGTLCPVADQDIINTLRTCNKYDGFLTLADVTKLLDTMQDDGPFTVFLPSNDALTKIPSEELSVLKENSTILREFLEYHIVRGAYFSGDLKDGQYLSTLDRRQPIRMGIRVDGCYRRLVEVNNSPVFKSDIPTKNGVIHIVDWILRPSDLQWCDGVVLP